MIDRMLNYGRDTIHLFLRKSSPCKKILDIGAGIGEDLMLARSVCPGAQLLAVECNQENIRMLKERGVDVYPINIERERLPLDDESVDIVIVNQVMEHTKEVFWIFHEITRVLRPDGTLILGVPNLASLHNRLLLLFGRQPSPLKMNSAHVRGFTKSDILRFLTSCWDGYALADFRGGNFYPFPPFMAIPLAKLFPSFSWGIFFLFKKNKRYADEFLRYPAEHRLETNFWLGDAQ